MGSLRKGAPIYLETVCHLELMGGIPVIQQKYVLSRPLSSSFLGKDSFSSKVDL